jgi:hemerythrin
MALFTWHSKYSVDNEELDNHHKTLFDILNKLYNSCFDNDNSITLGPIIDELVSYTNYHFSAEEQYMSYKGYNGIDKHISEHNIFRERISQLQHSENINDMAVTKELIVYLGNWLLNHVIVEDKKYSN